MSTAIHHVYKFRLYPTKEQKILLDKTFGCCRFLYNTMLKERLNVYQQFQDDKGALKNYHYTTESQYKKVYPFLAEVDAKALQSSTRNLIIAFKKFFNSLTKKKSQRNGYPRFKSKKARQAYTTHNINNNIKIDFGQRRLKLPKIKTWLRYKDNRFFQEKIRHVTVSKTKSEKYYVSILIIKEVTINSLSTIREERLAAFDMSASKFLISEIWDAKNPRFYRNEEKRLKKLHRQVSRKKKGSNNRKKARVRLVCCYEKIFHRKLHWTHAMVNELLNKYDAIILEDLNIKGMQQFNSGVAKSVTLDFSWGLFKTILNYKLTREGKHLMLVDRFFPSSKLCSACEWKNDQLELSEKIWLCEQCGTTHDRDLNASINLKKEGKVLLKKHNINILSTVGTTGTYACGDYGRLFSESNGRRSKNPSA